MEKLDFISRQLARTYRKRFEQYVITRIWHH
ncbi:MAG: AbaSI family restriction endonuclease, partial [Plesiomonas shigelloides]